MSRQGKFKYTGTSVWQKVDTLTGEILERQTVDEFERPVGRKDHFMITYLAEIISLIDALGNQKMKVVKYILQNMSKSENMLVITVQKLADKSGVSDSAGIIQRRTGVIMVSPKLVNNKTAKGEATLMVKYHQFESED